MGVRLSYYTFLVVEGLFAVRLCSLRVAGVWRFIKSLTDMSFICYHVNILLSLPHYTRMLLFQKYRLSDELDKSIKKLLCIIVFITKFLF